MEWICAKQLICVATLYDKENLNIFKNELYGEEIRKIIGQKNKNLSLNCDCLCKDNEIYNKEIFMITFRISITAYERVTTNIKSTTVLPFFSTKNVIIFIDLMFFHRSQS